MHEFLKQSFHLAWFWSLEEWIILCIFFYAWLPSLILLMRFLYVPVKWSCNVFTCIAVKYPIARYCCCCLVTQSCLTLCNPMDCSTPGFPVPHHLPELAQTCVHWVGDAIQPSHPLASPSPAFNQSFPASGSFPISQFFTSGGQRIGASASVLPMNTQAWFPLGLTGLMSLQSRGLSRAFSNTTV